MVKVSKFGWMEKNILEIGLKINNKELVLWFIQMVQSIMVNGLKVRKPMVGFSLKMEVNIVDSGRIIKSMVMGVYRMQMVQFTLVILKTAFTMEKAISKQKTKQNTMVISQII